MKKICLMLYVMSLCGVAYVVPASSAGSSGTDSTNKAWYRSSFEPETSYANKVLKDGLILANGEKPHEMVERVVSCIAQAELKYSLSAKGMYSTKNFAQKLGELCDQGSIVFSTPILTNAGRFVKRPLSACAMPPVDVRKDLKSMKKVIDQYHQDGMGTGFNLTDASDPINVLRYINDVACKGAESGNEQRPVGNMAILDVRSPHIEEFIELKVDADKRGENWKFNLSVNVDDEFIKAAIDNKSITLHNGQTKNANVLLEKIAQAAHGCGDPGLISTERMNCDNPTPSLGLYQTTAPCAEVGLAPGETCVFGYINLGKMLKKENNQLVVDFEALSEVAHLLMRALDNILEVSIQNYVSPESKDIMSKKRKVSIGVCGFADMLIKMGIRYESQTAASLLRDVLNFISYESKCASIKLAQSRGSFPALASSKYMETSFICDKFRESEHVTKEQWHKLACQIKEDKLLRNATTTALPPTGRSALVIEASLAIEPIFSLYENNTVNPLLMSFLEGHPDLKKEAELEVKQTGSCAHALSKIEHPFITATELTPEQHLRIVTSALGAIDESISKTVNVPSSATSKEIAHLYKEALTSGLKGISVYRDGSKKIQPKQLSKSSK